MLRIDERKINGAPKAADGCRSLRHPAAIWKYGEKFPKPQKTNSVGNTKNNALALDTAPGKSTIEAIASSDKAGIRYINKTREASNREMNDCFGANSVWKK